MAYPAGVNSTTTSSNDHTPVSTSQYKAQAQATILSSGPKQWLSTPKNSLIVLSILFVFAICVYVYWSWSSNRCIDAFHARAKHPLRTAWFYQKPAERGQHFQLPVGTFAWYTLGLDSLGSIKVPTGMTVHIISVPTVVKKTKEPQSSNSKNADTKAPSTCITDAQEDANQLVKPVEFELLAAPATLVCKENTTTDVSKVNWAQVVRIHII